MIDALAKSHKYNSAFIKGEKKFYDQLNDIREQIELVRNVGQEYNS